MKKVFSAKHKKNISEARKGIVFSQTHIENLRKSQLGKKKGAMSLENKLKISLAKKGHKTSEETRKKISEKLKGSNSLLWQGGITPIHKAIRRSLEYRLWRNAVLTRDNHTCIWCGSTKNLNADHIKPFALFPELRFAIDNGRTLCLMCHRTTDTYAGKSKQK